MLVSRLPLGCSLAAVLLLGGCHHCCHRQTGPLPEAYPVRPSYPPGQPFIGAPGNIPPANIPPAPVPGRTDFLPPRTSPEILLPERMPSTRLPAPPSGGAILLQPDVPRLPGPEVAEFAPRAGKGALAPPPPSAFPTPPGSSPMPVGIADFTRAKVGVATGLKPDLDGLTWLKQNGYKTVLYLKRPGDEDGAHRQQVEKNGMRFLSLSVSPETLTPQAVAEFNQIINDAGGRPLFVFDRDGSLAGGMWYLHFRTSELLSDDEARLRAGRLGLKENGSAEQKLMWSAVQRHLEALPQ